MTLDKIKFYIGEDLYNYWNSETSRLNISEAQKVLSSEIEKGILTDIKYIAELRLLNMKLEIKDNFKQSIISHEHSKSIEKVNVFNTIEN